MTNDIDVYMVKKYCLHHHDVVWHVLVNNITLMCLKCILEDREPYYEKCELKTAQK